MSLQNDFREVAAQLTMEDAETHATIGECRDARGEVATGIELSRDYNTLERASRALALCGGAAEAGELSRELARRFPESTLVNRVSLPVIAAMVALDRGDAAQALAVLEPVKQYDRAPSAEFWPPYLRGRAYLQLEDPRAAAAEFRRLIDHRGEVPLSALYALAHVGLGRSLALTGDTTGAAKAYEDFLVVWRGADAELPVLKDARREYARLTPATSATN
jgi:tetratricopeptide (TPR) repeat protein